MKAITKEAYAVYGSDDRGYSMGGPLAIYPIKAAAEGSEEVKSLGGYHYITGIKIVSFDDLSYIYTNVIRDKNKLIGKFPLYSISIVYQNYIYEGSFDKSEYIKEENLLEYLSQSNKTFHLSKYFYICDESDGYLLKSDKPVTIKSFFPSREIAIKHALSKLNEEEKKLLGLI